MYDDSGVRLSKLKVDGGMANNKLFLQMLANIVGINVSTPSMFETTALGAALAAGKAKGIDLFQLDNENEIETNASGYAPHIHDEGEDCWTCFSLERISWSCCFFPLERENHFNGWKKAVLKSFERLTPPQSIENKGKNISEIESPLDLISAVIVGTEDGKTHLSSTTVAWVTLTSVFSILLYMISRHH